MRRYLLQRRAPDGSWTTLYDGDDKARAIVVWRELDEKPLRPGEAWRVFADGQLEDAAWFGRPSREQGAVP